MDDKLVPAMMVILFLCVQAIGLATAMQYQGFVAAGEIEPMNDDPDDVGNVLGLFAYILAVTAVIIVAIRYAKRILVLIEALAIFATSDIVFELLIPYGIPLAGISVPIGTVLALMLTAAKFKYPSTFTQNLALVFAVSGAGAVLGSSFSIIPILFFMLFLSIYDFIAVFYTKHMVYMAKAITERPTAFTAAFPSGGGGAGKGSPGRAGAGHTYQLGGGDLVVPLMFSVSVLSAYGAVSALFAMAGSLASLLLLFNYVMKRPGNALPALPPICAGACLAFLSSLLL